MQGQSTASQTQYAPAGKFGLLLPGGSLVQQTLDFEGGDVGGLVLDVTNSGCGNLCPIVTSNVEAAAAYKGKLGLRLMVGVGIFYLCLSVSVSDLSLPMPWPGFTNGPFSPLMYA